MKVSRNFSKKLIDTFTKFGTVVSCIDDDNNIVKYLNLPYWVKYVKSDKTSSFFKKPEIFECTFEEIPEWAKKRFIKKAANPDEAFKIQEKYKGKPHGWVQWKGTDVCMDIHCKCGAHSHIDAEFAYHVKCPYCGTVYACNGHIELIELEEEPDSCVIIPEIPENN